MVLRVLISFAAYFLIKRLRIFSETLKKPSELQANLTITLLEGAGDLVSSL